MKRLAYVLIASFLLALPSVGSTETEVTRLDLRLPSEEISFDESTKSEYLKRLAERVRARLETADFKHYSVHVQENSVKVKIHGSKFPKHVLKSMIVPEGKLQIGRVLAQGAHWSTLTGQMPESLELRQPSESMDPSEAYVWSSSAERLAEFISEHDGSAPRTGLYPVPDGWRTVGYGLSGHEDTEVTDVQLESANNGTPFVYISLTKPLDSRIVATNRGISEWLFVLDGEIVAKTSSTGLKTRKDVSIRPPKSVSTDTAQKLWARQVAARLAAPYPFQPTVADMSDSVN